MFCAGKHYLTESNHHNFYFVSCIGLYSTIELLGW